jgi:accessory colonization factor AcfC
MKWDVTLLWFMLAIILMNPTAAMAQDRLQVYGPGGPYSAMREAAAEFSRVADVKVEVVAGPMSQWLAQAKTDADLVYSGAEFMMTDLIAAMAGAIDEATVTPLYLRPAAILVRPGNPKRIQDFPDLLRPGMNVLVVQGAGQTGLWEDIAGKQGDIRMVRALRNNIRAVMPNGADAKKRWVEDSSLDAWLTWNTWQRANPAVADLVPVSERYVIYRACGIALTKQGKTKKLAQQFVEFLLSFKGASIFAKWGWIAS